MAEPAFRVTMEDLTTGRKWVVQIPKDDYFLILTGEAHLANSHSYPKVGTYQLTIKGATNHES